MEKHRLIILGDKALDWPEDMPIPAKGDIVAVEDSKGIIHRGTVDCVHYLVSKAATEIRIETDPIY